jgi:UDP-GlcNAc:undecaprenyl-phosphate GlcNAc-1-phosphate transferase
VPFLAALGSAVLLVPAARRLGLAIGLVDRPSDATLAIHARPVSILGGPAVVAAVLGAAAITGDGLRWGLVAATLLALGAGLADDVRQLTPVVRLVLLAGAGAVLAAGDVRVEPLGALAGVATVALTLACANATNLIDGQNGLAGGLAAAAGAALAAAAPAGSDARTIGFAMAGACAGFLVWNLPGRIFLGNGGAYAVGTLLAAMAARVTAAEGWSGVVAVTACLGVLAFEMIFTVARRIGSGASLTSGDRLHSYDIVADRWASRLRSTIAFWIGAAIAGGIGVAAARLSVGAGAVLVGLSAVATAAWATRLWAGRASVEEQ